MKLCLICVNLLVKLFLLLNLVAQQMGGENNLKNFARNVVLLKQLGINPIVVHGGGPQIGQMLMIKPKVLY